MNQPKSPNRKPSQIHRHDNNHPTPVSKTQSHYQDNLPSLSSTYLPHSGFATTITSTKPCCASNIYLAWRNVTCIVLAAAAPLCTVGSHAFAISWMASPADPISWLLRFLGFSGYLRQGKHVLRGVHWYKVRRYLTREPRVNWKLDNVEGAKRVSEDMWRKRQ